MNLDTEILDVRAFQMKFGQIINYHPTHLTKRKLTERIECMQEELDEFKQACIEQDLAAQADALIDLVYFAKGTANMLGLPWDHLWDDVQRANMAKQAGVGPRGHKVDCIKPAGWLGPMTTVILQNAGYRREAFTTNGLIDESRCSDDPAV